jgi:hypothetical protein
VVERERKREKKREVGWVKLGLVRFGFGRGWVQSFKEMAVFT